MEKTPKKIVQSDLVCFLCAFSPNKEKFRVFGKSAVDILGLIKSAVFSLRELFVCNAYYKKLIRFEKMASNLRALQWELKDNYKKRGLRTKRLRKESTTQEALTDPIEQSLLTTWTFLSSSSTATKSLKFPTTSTSSFGQEPAKDSDFSFNTCPPALFLTSTPVAKVKAPSVHVPSKSVDTAPTLTSVKVVTQYPSKPVNQTLAKEYEAIGKALAYGPPHRLAKVVTKNKELIKLVVHNMMKLLSNEVSALCSRKDPSLLRKCGKQSNTL